MTAAGERTRARPIGALAAILLSFNGVVGAGIFALPGQVDTQFGSFGPWLFPLFGLLLLAVALPLAAVAARFEVNGGAAAYVGEAFGPFAGFQAGWLYYVARVASLAANSTVFAAYLVGLFHRGPGAKGVIAALLIGWLAYVNWRGLGGAIRILNWASAAKAGALILFALAGLWLFSDGLAPPGPFPPLSKMEAITLVIFYAFTGFEAAMVPAGETADARRAVPRALLLSIACTSFLYFLVQLAYSAVAPAGSADAPLIAYGTAVAGPVGEVLMTLTALASLAGNLNANMISSPRLSLAMAERGMLPRWLEQLHPRFGTPTNGILLFATVGALLALSGSFALLAVLGTVARVLMYLAIYAALPRLRAQAGERALPGGGLLVAMLLGSAVCLWALAQSEAQAWWLLAGGVLLGTLLFAATRLAARRLSSSAGARR